MSSDYFFSLYGRNIKGTFIKGFFMISDFPVVGGGAEGLIALSMLLIVSAIHIVLLPLTLTIGAGLKTLKDYFTRVYTTNEDKLNSIKQSISEINEDQIGELTKTVLEYDHPKSNSSRMLLEELSKPTNKADEILSELMQQKGKELRLEQLKSTNVTLPLLNKKLKKEIVNTIKLNKTHQAKLDEYSSEDLKPLRKQLDKERFDTSKILFSNYIKDEKNNGKKMFQIVVKFFEQKSDLDPNSSAKQDSKLTSPQMI